MARSEIEKLIINKFLEIRNKHGNAVWAIRELEWLVFVKHKEEFEKLTEEDQWLIRNLIGGFQRVHGK